MSPLGAQWTNLSSPDTYKPRVKLERNTGDILGRTVTMENANGAQAQFRWSGNTLELYDVHGGTSKASWTMTAP